MPTTLAPETYRTPPEVSAAITRWTSRNPRALYGSLIPPARYFSDKSSLFRLGPPNAAGGRHGDCPICGALGALCVEPQSKTGAWFCTACSPNPQPFYLLEAKRRRISGRQAWYELVDLGGGK
jgi:hypothetical protein